MIVDLTPRSWTDAQSDRRPVQPRPAPRPRSAGRMRAQISACDDVMLLSTSRSTRHIFTVPWTCAHFAAGSDHEAIDEYRILMNGAATTGRLYCSLLTSSPKVQVTTGTILFYPTSLCNLQGVSQSKIEGGGGGRAKRKSSIYNSLVDLNV